MSTHRPPLPNVGYPSFITTGERIDMENRARRRTQLRANDRERLRQHIQAEKCIEQVWDITETLRTDETLTTGRVGALKASMEGKLRLLDRVLPPLKAIEIQKDPENLEDPKTLSTAELIEIIMHKRREQVIDEAEYTEVKPPWEQSPAN